MHGVIAPPLIAFRNVDLAFGDHLVLGKLSFEIARGEIVCVVGPSGCGKTTALRVAAGLIPPTAGEVVFGGAPVKAPRRDVVIVFQDYAKRCFRGAPPRGTFRSRSRPLERRVRSGARGSKRS